MRANLTLLGAAVLAFSAACSSPEGRSPADAEADTGSTIDPDGGAPSLDDGAYRITVPLADGSADAVWIVAVSPDGPGPHPVVVYGHGQGLGGIANCYLDGPPNGFDARKAAEYAGALAAEGFLAVSILYRNAGDGAPGVGTLRLRDHYHRDARAFLAAARWARDEHGEGSNRVALIGSSMGTWSATWAASTLPEVAALQEGLDLRTVILQGHTANHLANLDDVETIERVRSGAGSPADIAQVTAVIGMSTIIWHSFTLDMSEVTIPDLEPGTELRDLVETAITTEALGLAAPLLFASANPVNSGCEDLAGRPPVCGGECLVSTFRESFLTLPTDATRYLHDEALEAFSYWKPPLQVDPGPDHANRLLRAMRRTSPAYSLEGLVTPRVLVLLSPDDHERVDAAIPILMNKLREVGAEAPELPLLSDPTGTCEHADYQDPSQPGCGWDATLAELNAHLR